MAWKKGETGNAKGRPRTGNSLAEAIRRRIDPDLYIDKLWEIAESSPSDQTRLRALEMLSTAGYKRPAQVIEVGPADPFEDMSEEELRALISKDDAELAELEADEPALLADGSGAHGATGAARSITLEAGPGDSRTTEAHQGAHVGTRATAYPSVLVRKRVIDQGIDDEESDS